MLEATDLAVRAPDEADARRRAERLFDAAAQSGHDLTRLLADNENARRVATLACQAAPYLATLLTRDPGRLARVAADPYLRREKPREVLVDEVVARSAAAGTPAELHTALRRVRADELVRLGVRELELGLDTEVGRELARLADACFDAAIRFHDRKLRARHGRPRYLDDDGHQRDATLAVIGMGKLGGEELNFASDVDVIYVYSSDQGEAGSLSLHEYFAKLALAVTAAMSEVTEDDVVFRVDLRLRPEGAKGAIANSVAQMERYYETFGRPWERQAWIKARWSAGDRALGEEVLSILRPFVFPRFVAPTVIDEVRDLNRRIKRELVRPRPAADDSESPEGFDLKNGEGGIREIEFFVQALQLIHAGKQPNLRCRGTLAVLDALLFAGLVTDEEHGSLWRAYRWLRHAEHVLQLEGGLQTQTVPDTEAALRVFAQRLGYPGSATAPDHDRDIHDAWREAPDVGFAIDLIKHTSAVSRMFASLGDPGEAAARRPGDSIPDDVAAIATGELTADAEAAALARLGFVDLTAASAELARARRSPDSPLSPIANERQTRLGAALLAEIAASADPDQALRYLCDLFTRRGNAWSIWRLLEENPAITRLFGSILGASAYLARTLVETPELIDLLVELGLTTASRDPAQVAQDLARRLTGVDRSDPEAAWSAVAEVKNGHVLRVGLADFAGALDPLAVCAELTSIAEACLHQALSLVEEPLAARHGRPPGDARLAVLGLGKLGGRELGYAADLDVVFVYTGDDGDSDGEAPLATVEWFSRLAQRLLGSLRQVTPSGRLYEVDTRLRPSGSQGLLVTSMSGWQRYHTTQARLWERQALIKLRPVAGDTTLGDEVARLAAQTVYGAPPEALGGTRTIAASILEMREKIERELGGPTDLKTGAGGVIDVEFAAQFLQLAHGHAHRELRTTSTIEALRAAARSGVAPAREAALLDQGYRFLRGIENRLRVVNDQPVHRLPETPSELDKLARRSGFPGGARLREHVERWQRDIRQTFLALRRVAAFAPRGASRCALKNAGFVLLVIAPVRWYEADMGIKKLDTIWLDGQLVPWDSATDHLLAHTMHYGVGAFEGIRAYQRADGRTAIFRLREHIERLIDSAAICTMDPPYTRDQLMQACFEVVRANKMTSCYLRPLMYLGYGALGLGSLEPPVRTMVACYEWGAYLGDDGLRKGIRCMVSGFTRANGNAVMNKGKICGQYVTSVLAKRMAIKSGFEEALMLDPQGYVAEGTGENIFVVKRDVVRTPATAAAILAGITRDTAIQLLREQGVDVREEPIARDELYTADEVFLTGTAAEITPVREIDHRKIGRGEAGPVTRRLQEVFFSIVKGKDAKHDHWLSYL